MGDSVRDSPRALAGVALGEEAGGSLGAEEDEGLHVTTDEALPESRLDLEAAEAASLGPKRKGGVSVYFIGGVSEGEREMQCSYFMCIL